MTFEEWLIKINGGRKDNAKRDFARRLEVDPSLVSHWCSGRSAPEEETKKRISREFKIPLLELDAIVERTRAQRRLDVHDPGVTGIARRRDLLLPVLGVATDGMFPFSSTAQPLEALPLPIAAQKLFALRLGGKDLEPLAKAGEYAVLAEQAYASREEIVLARLGDACLMRRYFPDEKQVELRAENPKGAKCFARPDEVKIIGVLRCFVRKP